MKSSVITFPGSNCDRDMDVALKKFGFKNKMVWHDDVELPKKAGVNFLAYRCDISSKKIFIDKKLKIIDD